MKNNLLYHFLQFPELNVSSETFGYVPFSFTETFAEITDVDFPSHIMLGKQAEFLFEQLLKQSQEYNLLAANVQIQGDTKTLGELDYIIERVYTADKIHVELACKFYLLDATLGKNCIEQWIGPNRKDKLVDKLQKLKTHQFPLLHRRETAETLEKLSVTTSNMAQQLCLKAALFLPFGMQKEQLPVHFRKCVVGTYLTPSQFKTKEIAGLYAFPKKTEWLLPKEMVLEWVSFKEAQQKIATAITEKRSPLVYQKTTKGIEQFFVVWW